MAQILWKLCWLCENVKYNLTIYISPKNIVKYQKFHRVKLKNVNETSQPSSTNTLTYMKFHFNE